MSIEMSMKLTKNKKKNGYENSKKGVVFEDEVVDILARIRYFRRTQLIEHLLEVHKGELGYSEKTINRKLDEMIKNGTIISLKYDDLSKYGIKETDKRVSYLILKRTMKTKEDLDKIFSYMDSSEPDIQKEVLKEITRNGKYVLDPYQLATLATHLNSNDNELVDILLVILCEYIIEKNIEPSNRDKLLENLRFFLKKHNTGTLEYPNVRRRILWLLGHYGDSSVIEQLKKDAENLEDPNIVVSEYCNEQVAPLIEEHLFELFKFRIELKLKGKEKASEFISRIKDRACNPKKPLEALEGNTKLEGKINGIPRGK